MKKILFPTDFSEAADCAFEYALELADVYKAEIVTVHVYSLPNVSGARLPNTLREVYESVTLDSFADYKDNVPHLHAIARNNNKTHLTVRHMMIEEQRKGVVNAILRAQNRTGAEMIVMGTTGASGLKEVFLGSVAAEVMENSRCPVLAVPHGAKFGGRPKRFAVTTEYALSEVENIRYVIGLAEKTGGDVVCLHIDLKHTEKFTRRMDEFMTRFEGEVNVAFEVVPHTSLEKGISEFVDNNQIDILAMTVTRRNFIQELFTYSVAKKMAYHTTVPILSLRR